MTRILIALILLLGSTSYLAEGMGKVKRLPIHHFLVQVCDAKGCSMRMRPHWVVRKQDGSISYEKAYQ